jgi:hypothetical protein
MPLVEIDYFYRSGTFYKREFVEMEGYYNMPDVEVACRTALVSAKKWNPHFNQVIPNPYHKAPHPVLFPSRTG